MTAGANGLTLHMERVLPASRAEVFKAHTEPGLLAMWWGPTGFSVPSVDFDARVGGRYRIAMQPPDGELFQLVGEILEFDAPCRLAYTFRWEPPDRDDRETVVTVVLDDLGASTSLTVDQGAFATEERLALHVQGWTETLERLEAFLARA